MSYGVYSEVYFAICFYSKVYIKIGETSNSRRRNNQLQKQGYYIVKACDVEGAEAERLFVESFLRARISATGRATQFGKDYFECDCPETVSAIKASFENWVNEAATILRQMANIDDIMFKPTPKPNSPIIPKGKEKLYNRILEDCKVRGTWTDHYQLTTKEEEQFLHELNTTLASFGYECFARRNYSWAYFTVKKIYC